MTGPHVSRAVSVVMPVFNGERFIADAIRSVLQQDHRPVEVIVVDDGSTDSTASTVRAIGSEEVTLFQQANSGHGAARNLGVAHARGEFVAFLDADDLFLPGKLRTQIDRLDADPALGFTVCGMRGVVDAATAAMLSPRQLARMAGVAPAWLPSGIVARRCAFDAVGPFDPSLRVACDTDWFARARWLGVQGEVVDQVLLERRMHGGNLSLGIADSHADLARVARTAIARRRL